MGNAKFVFLEQRIEKATTFEELKPLLVELCQMLDDR